MSSQPNPSSQAPDGPLILSVSTDEDFARPLLEEQLAGLKELADLGRDMARSLVKIVAREAEAVEPDPTFDTPAYTLALDRAARSVRMSYALEHTVIDLLRGVGRIEADKTDKALRAAEAEAQARLTKARAAADAPVTARKRQINEAVTGILSDAHDEDDDGFDRHVREANERLRDHEVFDDVLGRPTSEVIADICRLLGLEPNWEGLAFEAWALEERRSGKIGDPLKSPPPWTGKRPGIRGRLLKSEPLPIPEEMPVEAEIKDVEAPPPEPEIEPPAPPPYVPPPDPDILPGYPVGLPGELPPLRRDGRRAQPMPAPRNYTYGFD